MEYESQGWDTGCEVINLQNHGRKKIRIPLHGYLENGSSISPGTSNDAIMISLICLLQHKYLVPSSTINIIISETAAVLGNFTTQVKDKIKSLLELYLVDQSVVMDIMTQLSKDLHTKNSFDRFSTEYSRREYIKGNLLFDMTF